MKENLKKTECVKFSYSPTVYYSREADSGFNTYNNTTSSLEMIRNIYKKNMVEKVRRYS